ncbi:MAG: right-handed parallel beta-helix repeat-containing protein [Thermoleophilia bacterium]|nr:right-handed parallel beta-helix repeat-containing protein [Thermoleophilia bacterium]
MSARSRRRARSRILAAFSIALAAAAVAAPGAEAVGGPVLYVDGSSASCTDGGTGTQAAPFCTIGAAAAVVAAGQTVQVAAGVYRESVTVRSSGTSSAPIVFAAAPGATVTVTGGAHGFAVSGRSWVAINGFDITATSGHGLDVSSGSSHVILSGNHVSQSGQPSSGLTAYGIRLSGVTDSVVSGNTVDHNSDSGIAVVGSSARIQVLGNKSFANARQFQRAAAGIRLAGSTDGVVAGNVVHDNEDSGIESYPGTSSTLIEDNVSYRNGDHGIDNLGATNQRILANTVYGNVTAGINVEGSSTGATVENNISVDNGIGSPRTHSDIRIERGSTAGTIVDSNLVWLTTQDTLYIWDSVGYSTLAAFQAASGQGTHEIWADPKLADAGASDFHLTASSPAIDSADSGVSGQPATDADGNPRVDIPDVPNTGLGPTPYVDRGAFELQAASPPPDAPPAARLSVSPSSGTAPLAVTADASASTDTDATPIASYRFDFGDGTVVGPQASATATHTYAGAGTFTVTVAVADTAGNSSTAQATLTVSASGGGGGTNLVGNPGFETDLTGWNTSGSDAGIALARVSGGHSGSWAAQLSNTTTGPSTCLLNDSPNWVKLTAAGTYTASLWARADAAGATLKLRLREYAGSTLVGSATAQATLSTSWQQVTVSYQVGAPGASSLDVNAYVSKAAPGVCFYVDDTSVANG